ncbi:MAG: hypothetical protein ACM3S0_09090 [Acidobacteriota bacterium]
MNPDIAIAQLSIVDGAWQESPDNLAILDEGVRGTLCLLTEVAGEVEGRDVLAREILETARREFSGGRGSITLALTQAVRETNNYFYNVNLNTPPESRRIAGLTAVVLRENDLFIAQAGPGLTCVARGAGMERYPEQSAWFDPSDEIGDFTMPGEVPLGLRKEYMPDLFHVTLQPGDTILLSTRSLAHLLTNEELLDTITRRHPDEIIETLEDIAGAADLSAIAIRLAGAPVEPVAAPSLALETTPTPSMTFTSTPAEEVGAEYEEASAPEAEPLVRETPSANQADNEGARLENALALERARAEQQEQRRIRAEQGRARRNQLFGSVLAGIAGLMAAVAGLFTKIDWTRIGATVDRAISTLLRGFVQIIIFAVRAFLPGTPEEGRAPTGTRGTPSTQTAWRWAALILPIVLVLAGGAAWVTYRQDAQRVQAAQIAQLLDQASVALKAGDNLAKTDKASARDSYQRALSLAQQAQKLSPTNSTARSVSYQAQDGLDGIAGISVLFFLPKFAVFSDGKANPTRIVSHLPDLFIFDRGTQRIYRYAVSDTGSTATPASGDGVILKAGDKIGERTVGELIDILWIDAGRLVALDRSGLFLQYDPVKSTWTARAASDGSQWARVTMASSYVGNLYLLDPGKNQIWKYVASAEGVWSSAVTYFAPGVNVDLSAAVDMAIDGDVWVQRGDGSVWRFSAGKLADFAPRDLETPISKSAALFTAKETAWLYVADVGNQRIVQFDKVTGKFIRQFKPRGEIRESFNALKTFAVDETSKRLFFINGNQAYLATIPQ